MWDQSCSYRSCYWCNVRQYILGSAIRLCGSVGAKIAVTSVGPGAPVDQDRYHFCYPIALLEGAKKLPGHVAGLYWRGMGRPGFSDNDRPKDATLVFLRGHQHASLPPRLRAYSVRRSYLMSSAPRQVPPVQAWSTCTHATVGATQLSTPCHGCVTRKQPLPYSSRRVSTPVQSARLPSGSPAGRC